MRKQLLSVFLPLLLLGLMASAAETPAPQQNELQRVNVVRGTDDVRVEINARGAMTPKLSTADSPARVIVDLPGTVMATGQSRIMVGSAGIKGVRIGMDGQTPPTTRIVVDMEHACRYELTPSADGKLVLTLHTQRTTAASASVPRAETKTMVKTVAQTSVAPTNLSMSPFAPRVMEVTPKTQPVAAAAPVVATATTPSIV
ncbi:MAG: AMIN domain-containing protein, partial [Candidatus Sulfotelmatobacter sp.]